MFLRFIIWRVGYIRGFLGLTRKPAWKWDDVPECELESPEIVPSSGKEPLPTEIPNGPEPSITA
jgi:hypothetical protein